LRGKGGSRRGVYSRGKMKNWSVAGSHRSRRQRREPRLSLELGGMESVTRDAPSRWQPPFVRPPGAITRRGTSQEDGILSGEPRICLLECLVNSYRGTFSFESLRPQMHPLLLCRRAIYCLPLLEGNFVFIIFSHGMRV